MWKVREQHDTEIIKRIEEESAKFKEILEEQKKSVNESEEAMFEILRDMIIKIKKQIDLERKEREENEETLLSLLEDTWYKLGASWNL